MHRLRPEAVTETVFYVSEQAALTVFAPSHRAGIDVAILADCSGSMGVEDLTEVAEAAPSSSGFRWLRPASVSSERSISRIRALQRALTDLLERRLQIVGSASRIALIAFGDRSELRFPRVTDAVKMIEIDGSTPPELVRQFRDTIATLKAENWNTNIGQALQFAAAHISENGKPDNERLIVLISDGADWRPRGDDATGELVNAMDEPVSLMEHLHESMNIHLHAIGISPSEIYDRYLRRRGESTSAAHVGHRPNHKLLARLVEVGGGDPTRTGDAGVLEEYLQGLGTGVTRSVRIPKGNRPPRTLSDAELKQILVFHGSPPPRVPRPEDRDLVQFRDRLRRQYQDCNRNCLVHTRFRLFNPSPEAYDELFEHVIHIPAVSLPDYCYFINQLHKVFDEGVAEPVRRWTRDQDLPAPANQIAEILHDEPFDRLSILRHKLSAHDGFRGSGAEAASKLANIFEQMVGVKSIARDDALMWLRLQKATLDLLSRILDQVLAACPSLPLAFADGEYALEDRSVPTAGPGSLSRNPIEIRVIIGFALMRGTSGRNK